MRQFTRVPTNPGPGFATEWIERYERGWEDGRRAGFAIRDASTCEFLGFAGVVDLELPALQGEIGYIVAPHARGRGLALRSVELLTRWSLDVVGLRRVELLIDHANAPSRRVAERAGYTFEGILRDVHVKEDVRSDVEVWSRLARD